MSVYFVTHDQLQTALSSMPSTSIGDYIIYDENSTPFTIIEALNAISEAVEAGITFIDRNPAEAVIDVKD